MENHQIDVLSQFRIDGKKAIVTGAATGLGRAMAFSLANSGADIAIADRDIQGAEVTAKKIRSIGRKSIALHTDVSNSASAKEMVIETLKEFGKIDVLVNNAGIPPIERVPTDQMQEESYFKVIDVDLSGVFLCSKLVGKEMVKQKSGKIINIASISGLIVNKGQIGLSGFCSAKAAVIHLTRVLAVEWAEHNIQVNSISPGYMNTAALKDIGDNPLSTKKLTDLVPMGRIGEPEELGGAVLFLSSAASSYITGHNLVVDGGHTAW